MNDFRENFLNFDVLDESWGFLLSGLRHTVLLVVAAFALALVCGGLVAFGRTRSNRLVRGVTIAYIDVMRSLPPLVVLMVAFYVLPGFGLPSLSPFHASVLTFGLIQAAFIGEIYRGGIIAIERGQTEAALSVGFNWIQTARFVVLPQVLRIVFPPLTNQATQLTRDSALAFFIAYPELLKEARQAVSITHNLTPLMAAAVMYALLLLGLQIFSARVERRLYSEALGR